MLQQTDNAEFVGQIIDIFEDFLEKKGIDIPNPDREEQSPTDGAILYGMDYSDIQEKLETLLINWRVIEPLGTEHKDAVLSETQALINLAKFFPGFEKPEDAGEKMSTMVHVTTLAGAEKLEELQRELHSYRNKSTKAVKYERM